VEATLADLTDLATQIDPLEPLTQQRDRLQQQLSRVEAAQQFEAELQALVTQGQGASDRYQTQAATALATLAEWQQSLPLLSAESMASLEAAIAAGLTLHQDLLSNIEGILADLHDQTDAATLTAQLNAVQQRISDSQQHHARLAAMPQLQQQHQALLTQRQQLQSQLDTLPAVGRGGNPAAGLAKINAALAQLEDPRGRCAVLEKSRQQQPAIAQRHAALERAQADIAQQLETLSAQLQTFAALDTDVALHQRAKQEHQGDYLQYLHHQQAAQACPQLEQAMAAAQQAIDQLQQQWIAQQADLQTAQAQADPQQLQAVEQAYVTVRSERDRLSGSLPQQQQLQQELAAQVKALEEIADKRQTAIAEKRQRDRIRRFINFARKAYKEAGPRITERYVQQVSREADRLFRELLNRPNLALTWTRDYDIQVQEGASTRRFVNLSGGEQMCAALAVRLALLKVLAAIDVAFFDEPTTNMDRPRRERLAEAISRIKTFKQLFVISHDDTFETVTENIIQVEREG
jgi:exonuclease SbcC